ncbi:MAG: S8 family serine peptidase [Gemmatimonadota bacterium]
MSVSPRRHAARTLSGAALLLFAAACSETDLAGPAVADVDVPLVGAFDMSGDPATGRHLVMFKGQGPANFAQTVADLGGTVEFSHPIGIAIVSGLDAAGATALAGTKGIGDVQADESFQMDDQLGSAEDAGAIVASPSDPTTASRYSRQWNLPAIGANVAWAAGRLGSSAVTVAILDSGVDPVHPDLAGRVDASRSFSYVPSDDALVDAFFPGAPYWIDLRYHGTHVAATVASNALAAAGVTSGTTLISVKVCNVNGSCPFSSVIAGVLHAADNGAQVANMSLGGGFTKAGNGRFVGFINQVFNYARSRGVTMVVAAGNSALDLDHNGNTFTSYCDVNVICVSATGPTSGGTTGPWPDADTPAVYTNFGRSAISVAAPGGNTGASVWAACSTFSLVVPVCRTGVFILGISGTSMATPHVAGLAALLVEDYGANPGRIRGRIQATADDLGQRGTDPFYGKGRINVPAALGLN